MYGGEVLKEKGGEQMISHFLCESFRKIIFVKLEAKKAFNAQNGTAEDWTVGHTCDDHLFVVTRISHTHGEIDYGVCGGGMCDGLCKHHLKRKLVHIFFFLSIFFFFNVSDF